MYVIGSTVVVSNDDEEHERQRKREMKTHKSLLCCVKVSQEETPVTWEVYYAALSYHGESVRMAWLCRRIFLSKSSKDWARITLWNWF